MKIIGCRNYKAHPFTVVEPWHYAGRLCGRDAFPNDITGVFNESDSYVIDPNHPKYDGTRIDEKELLSSIIREIPDDKEVCVLWSGGRNSTNVLDELIKQKRNPKILCFCSTKYENPERYDELKASIVHLDQWNIRGELNRFVKDCYVLTGFNGRFLRPLQSRHGIPMLSDPNASIEDAVSTDKESGHLPKLKAERVITAFHELEESFGIPFELSAMQYCRLLRMSCLWRHFDNLPKLSCDYPENVINPYADLRFMRKCVNDIGTVDDEPIQTEYPCETWVVSDKFPTGDVLTDEGNIHLDMSEGMDSSVSFVAFFVTKLKRYGIEPPKFEY